LLLTPSEDDSTEEDGEEEEDDDDAVPFTPAPSPDAGSLPPAINAPSSDAIRWRLFCESKEPSRSRFELLLTPSEDDSTGEDGEEEEGEGVMSCASD
jgi:hypothetical protein